MKEAIWRIGGLAIAISALVLIAAPADAQMRPMMIPLTTTMVIAKPEPGEIFGNKQVVTMGVGGKIYTFLLKDAYVDDPRDKVRWPDVWSWSASTSPTSTWLVWARTRSRKCSRARP